MKGILISYTVILILGFLIMLFFALKRRRVFKAFILNGFFGITALAIINLTSFLSGVHIPINYYTVIGSSVFGIPSICANLLLNFIFI